jgi:NhaC family Na+:H+ antiporter
MSPISDTTNLAALSAETDLYSHIKSMAYTTGPAYVITLIAFSWLGYQYADQPLPQAELDSLLGGLKDAFTINLFMLLPLIVLLILSIKGIVAEAGMLISSLVAAALAIFIQNVDVSTVISSFYDGAIIATGNEKLDPLLNRGGITDMAWTFTLSFIAIGLGAILEKMGFLSVLMNWLLQKLARAASVVTSAIMGTFVANMLLGESYVSMILSGQMFKDKFDEVGVDRKVLSRSLEEGGTLLTALIPWTTTGAFYAATLGVATLDYAQWSLLNWINPLIGILFAWLGVALFRTTAKTIRADKTIRAST